MCQSQFNWFSCWHIGLTAYKYGLNLGYYMNGLWIHLTLVFARLLGVLLHDTQSLHLDTPDRGGSTMVYFKPKPAHDWKITDNDVLMMDDYEMYKDQIFCVNLSTNLYPFKPTKFSKTTKNLDIGSPQFWNFAQYLLLATWVKPYPMEWGRAGRPCRRGFITWHDAYILTHKGGLKLRACNSQPSEPFIYWGLKVKEAHLMTLVYAKINFWK